MVDILITKLRFLNATSLYAIPCPDVGVVTGIFSTGKQCCSFIDPLAHLYS